MVPNPYESPKELGQKAAPRRGPPSMLLILGAVLLIAVLGPLTLLGLALFHYLVP